MDESALPVDAMWVDDVETIKVVANQRRLQILQRMQQPTTVKAIAAELDVPASKLYYHVNLLEKHGLIRVVDHNLDSGIVEKVYQVTARQLKIVNPLVSGALHDEAADAILTSLLEETQRAFRRSFAARSADEPSPPRHPFLSKKAVRLTEEQLTQLHGKLDALMKEVAALAVDNKESTEPLYDLTVVFFKQTPPAE